MFTLFDFLAFGIIFVCLTLSAMRGLVAEVVSFGAWIAALVAARLFAVPVSDVVFANMQPRPMAVVCAFVLIYVLARLATLFIQYALDFVIKTAKLSSLNRLLGALLGAAKGIVVVSIVVLACSFSSLPQDPEWQNAYTSPFFEELAMLAVPYLPEFLAEQITFDHPSAASGEATPTPTTE